jgi:glucan biosynthesis protein C
VHVSIHSCADLDRRRTRINSPVAAGVMFFAIHLFRMTSFFLIAGLFAHMMLNRRGNPRLYQGPPDPHRHDRWPSSGRRSSPPSSPGSIWMAAMPQAAARFRWDGPPPPPT